LRELLRITSTQLQSDWMFERIERKQPFATPPQNRTGGEHFRVNQSPTRQKPMEKPAMPIGPLHHRSDTKTTGQHFQRFLLFFSHFRSFSGHVVPWNDYRTDLQRRLKDFYRPDRH
jgi:hypothetical protein